MLRAAFATLLAHPNRRLRGAAAAALSAAAAAFAAAAAPEASEVALATASPKAGAAAKEGEEQRLSAHVVGCSPLVSPTKAEILEDPNVRGAASDDFRELLACVGEGAREVFRLGRVAVCSPSARPEQPEAAPFGGMSLNASCFVANDGNAVWPASAAVVHVGGDDLGFSSLPLGPLVPGEAAEIVMDFVVPRDKAKPGSISQSAWAIVDAASGKLLGPVLVLEVFGFSSS